jgi:hypothetical protein
VEFELTVTVTDHGHDLENGERFAQGFKNTHPEVGAIVEQSIETRLLSVTFWFEAEDFPEAAERGAQIFTEGATASGLKASEFVGAKVSAVQPEQEEREARELQPA